MQNKNCVRFFIFSRNIRTCVLIHECLVDDATRNQDFLLGKIILCRTLFCREMTLLLLLLQYVCESGSGRRRNHQRDDVGLLHFAVRHRHNPDVSYRRAPHLVEIVRKLLVLDHQLLIRIQPLVLNFYARLRDDGEVADETLALKRPRDSGRGLEEQREVPFHPLTR